MQNAGFVSTPTRGSASNRATQKARSPEVTREKVTVRSNWVSVYPTSYQLRPRTMQVAIEGPSVLLVLSKICKLAIL